MHNQPLYAHFVELPLWSGESLAGSGCFCWKSNWTKFDHVGTTGGNWETISGSFSISFRSKLEVQSQCAPLLSPSGDLGIGLVWHNLSPPHPTDFLVPLLKSSSNWTKLSMRGPQLFSGWYQMILGVFRCTQLFSDCFLTMFSDC